MPPAPPARSGDASARSRAAADGTRGARNAAASATPATAAATPPTTTARRARPPPAGSVGASCARAGTLASDWPADDDHRLPVSPRSCRASQSGGCGALIVLRRGV
jgi:hypothetical protein